MKGEKSSHLHNRPQDVEEEEEEKGVGVCPAPVTFQPSEERVVQREREKEKIVLCPEVKRCLRRYKCHRLTAGGVAAHADLCTIKQNVARISVPGAGAATQLSSLSG